jgi:hypothetical protein
VSKVIQCDQCRKTFTPPWNGYDERKPPVFALTVNHGTTMAINDRMSAGAVSAFHYDFCSMACLKQYLDGLDEKGRLKMPKVKKSMKGMTGAPGWGAPDF